VRGEARRGRSRSGHRLPTETTPYVNLFRFAGGLYTSTLELHKFGMRWYDQKLGRWTQQDPLDQTGDLQEGNRYQYAADDPVNQVDPAGTWSYTVHAFGFDELGGLGSLGVDNDGGGLHVHGSLGVGGGLGIWVWGSKGERYSNGSGGGGQGCAVVFCGGAGGKFRGHGIETGTTRGYGLGLGGGGGGSYDFHL
jgi:RHS repeat-associated protein